MPERAMTEIDRICDQLTRSYRGPAWHGDSVMEILAGVTAEQAGARPIPHAHSIWEIMRHIAVWMDIAARRLRGEPFNPTDEQDWPMIGAPDAAEWPRELDALQSAFEDLRQTAAGLTDADLDTVRPGFTKSPYLTLHGVVQHTLYHAGQIALLKKAMT
jgi:uncharacterized damage-inducible protein DinB